MAEPKAPKLVEMVAVHLVHVAGGKHVAPGSTFSTTTADAEWLVENGAATYKVEPVQAPTED